ncbi:MAG: S8 family serine peptidase [Solirubrobacteraceae bacterium]
MGIRVAQGVVGAAAVGLTVLAFGGGVAFARPLDVVMHDRFGQQPTNAQCEAEYGFDCYSAAQIERAYGLGPLYARGIDGRGETIAIVDSFGSPTIQSDLQVFDHANHLPPPPSFEVIQPAGPVPPYDPDNSDSVGWAEEASLDVQMAHTIAPGANLLMVETPVDETEGVTGLPQMIASENYVIDHHLGDVISQSFGATEQTFSSPSQIYGLRSAYENAAAHGVTVLAATGDAGATDYELNVTDFYPFPVVDFPADDPLVTAVGGLNLTLDQLGNRTAPDTVWNDPAAVCASPCAGNGGRSTVFSRPFYQDSVQRIVGGARGLPDVSLSASVSGSVDTYFGFTSLSQGIPGAGWYPSAGTSEASPLMAGEVALADQIAGHSLGLINPTLYAMGDGGGSGLTDTTIGNNTVTFTQDGKTITVQGWNAAPGYDLASGLGEPNGLFPFQLAAYAAH